MGTTIFEGDGVLSDDRNKMMEYFDRYQRSSSNVLLGHSVSLRKM
jgi:hypothetical protein